MDQNNLNSDQQSDRRNRVSCPDCKDSVVDTEWVEHSFRHGSGSDEVTLTVSVPVKMCQNCGFQFLDDEAEDLKHEAVCRHLAVIKHTLRG